MDLCFWTSAANFTAQMTYLKSSGVAVKTMHDAFDAAYPQAGTVDLTVPAGADHPNHHDSLTATAKGFIDLDRPTSCSPTATPGR